MNRDEWINRATAYCMSVGFEASDAEAFCEAVYDGVDDQARLGVTPEEYIREELSYCTDDGEPA